MTMAVGGDEWFCVKKCVYAGILVENANLYLVAVIQIVRPDLQRWFDGVAPFQA